MWNLRGNLPFGRITLFIKIVRWFSIVGKQNLVRILFITAQQINEFSFFIYNLRYSGSKLPKNTRKKWKMKQATYRSEKIKWTKRSLHLCVFFLSRRTTPCHKLHSSTPKKQLALLRRGNILWVSLEPARIETAGGGGEPIEKKQKQRPCVKESYR